MTPAMAPLRNEVNETASHTEKTRRSKLVVVVVMV
jgi:hypothetical protein